MFTLRTFRVIFPYLGRTARLRNVGFKKLNFGVMSRNLASASRFKMKARDDTPEEPEQDLTYTKRENNHALYLLKSSPEYSKTLYSPPPEDSKPVNPAVARFVEASTEPDLKPLDDSKYETLIKGLLEATPGLSDDDLLRVLNTIYAFPYCSAYSPNFAKLWKGLDAECVKRLKSGEWSMDQLFVVEDAWYPSDVLRKTDFLWTLVKKAFRKCERFSKEQFVRFMFTLNKSRHIHKSINTYELEYNLLRLYDEMNVRELTLVCMGFFKTKTIIRDPELLTKILGKIGKNAAEVDSVQLAAVAKEARLSCSNPVSDAVLNFITSFGPHVDRLSDTACLHLILAGSHHINTIDFEVMYKVLDKLERNFHTLRLKEIERLCLVMSMFNVRHDSLWPKFAEEVAKPERQKEVELYGRCLSSIAHYLTFQGIFPEDLISTVLSPAYQKKFYGSADPRARRESLCLDLTVGLELDGYKGNRLKESLCHYLLKSSTFWIRQENVGRVGLFESNLRSVAEVLEKVFNTPKSTFLTSILPQYHTIEVLFCTDKDGKALETPAAIRNMDQWELKRLSKAVQTASIVFHVFILIARQSQIYNTGEITGQTRLRERQMRKMGYITHMIDTAKWLELDDNNRENLVQQLVANGVAEFQQRDAEYVSRVG